MSHVVTIPSQNWQEAMDWCRAAEYDFNSSIRYGMVTYDYAGRIVNTTDHPVRFVFVDANQAMMFKLVWGGGRAE